MTFQHNGTQHKGLFCDIQHNKSAIMLSISMLSVDVLFIVVLNVTMLSIIMLNVLAYTKLPAARRVLYLPWLPLAARHKKIGEKVAKAITVLYLPWLP